MRTRSRSVPLVLALAASVAAGALIARARGTGAKSGHVMLMPDQLEWGPLPGAPPGAQLAVLAGDPMAEGSAFVMRIKTPDGFRIPPHWHPKRERITVLQGTLRLTAGKKFDEAALHDLPAGAYAEMPPRTPHFGASRGETIIQVNGVGKWKIVYVNAEDAKAYQGKPAQGTTPAVR